ncbi:MAG: hypothetical protein DRI57_09615 [Deltaproteobacteria bacterium]|nr:MAG: hypothetical protein DRI57_09615 [Deltaproteobacteria bacterium]
MEKICSLNFIKIFAMFENRLNAAFQRNTEFLRGGSINDIRKSGCYEYEKRLVSKDNVTLEVDILFDRTQDDYLYYSYNIFFGKNKLMFHYEPTHTEHFQPHVNVYVGEKELKNDREEGIHIITHKYHPFEILSMIERYFA